MGISRDDKVILAKKGYYNKMSEDNIEKLIEKYKDELEAEMDEKKRKASECVIDMQDIMTAEEFDAICHKIENFKGKVMDMSAVQRFKKIEKGVKWMDAHCSDVTSILIDGVSRDKANAMAQIEIRPLSSMNEEASRVLSAMSGLADEVFFSSLGLTTIAISFTIFDVWS